MMVPEITKEPRMCQQNLALGWGENRCLISLASQLGMTVTDKVKASTPAKAGRRDLLIEEW